MNSLFNSLVFILFFDRLTWVISASPVKWKLYSHLFLRWNEAAHFCRKQGGHLPVTDDYLTFNAFGHWVDTWPAGVITENAQDQEMFTGLYIKENESGGYTYYWERGGKGFDVSAIPTEFWATNHPERLHNQHCVRINKNTQLLQTVLCGNIPSGYLSKNRVVCEFYESCCTLSRHSTLHLTSANTTSSYMEVASLEECWQICERMQTPGTECLEAKWEARTTTGEVSSCPDTNPQSVPIFFSGTAVIDRQLQHCFVGEEVDTPTEYLYENKVNAPEDIGKETTGPTGFTCTLVFSRTTDTPVPDATTTVTDAITTVTDATTTVTDATTTVTGATTTVTDATTTMTDATTTVTDATTSGTIVIDTTTTVTDATTTVPEAITTVTDTTTTVTDATTSNTIVIDTTTTVTDATTSGTIVIDTTTTVTDATTTVPEAITTVTDTTTTVTDATTSNTIVIDTTTTVTDATTSGTIVTDTTTTVIDATTIVTDATTSDTIVTDAHETTDSGVLTHETPNSVLTDGASNTIPLPTTTQPPTDTTPDHTTRASIAHASQTNTAHTATAEYDGGSLAHETSDSGVPTHETIDHVLTDGASNTNPLPTTQPPTDTTLDHTTRASIAHASRNDNSLTATAEYNGGSLAHETSDSGVPTHETIDHVLTDGASNTNPLPTTTEPLTDTTLDYTTRASIAHASQNDTALTATAEYNGDSLAHETTDSVVLDRLKTTVATSTGDVPLVPGSNYVTASSASGPTFGESQWGVPTPGGSPNTSRPTAHIGSQCPCVCTVTSATARQPFALDIALLEKEATSKHRRSHSSEWAAPTLTTMTITVTTVSMAVCFFLVFCLCDLHRLARYLGKKKASVDAA